MYDAPASPRALGDLRRQRETYHQAKHSHQYEMELVGRGVLPGTYRELFTERELIYLMNFIRVGGERMAGKIGQPFPIYFAPDDESDAKRKQAEKRERITYGYYSAGQGVNVGFDATIKALAWHLAFQCEAVAQVKFDYRRRTPYITHRHPCQHFAPQGWHPWGDAPLNGTMFGYKDTLENLLRRYPHVALELSNAYDAQYQTASKDASKVLCSVAEYYHTDAWYLATADDHPVILYASESGDKNVFGPDYIRDATPGHPGVCPITVMTPYDPTWARSIYADQVAHQAVLARMLTQSMGWTDKNLEPRLFVQGLEDDEIAEGPLGVTRLSSDEKAQVIQIRPEGTPPTQAMMQFLIAVDQRLNRHPEIEEGSGDANSAKALNELKSGPIETVREYFWPAMFQGIPRVLSHCMRMDINLNGNDDRTISGRTPELHDKAQSAPFTQKYRPYRDLSGYEDAAEVEPGILLKYMGHIDNMQAVGSKMMSRRTALEFDDRIRDVERELQRLDKEDIERVAIQMLQAQAQMLAGDALIEIARLVDEENKSYFQAIGEVAAQGKLYQQPQAPPGAAQPPGAPNAEGQQMALQNGGQPPNLQVLRGGADALGALRSMARGA